MSDPERALRIVPLPEVGAFVTSDPEIAEKVAKALYPDRGDLHHDDIEDAKKLDTLELGELDG